MTFNLNAKHWPWSRPTEDIILIDWAGHNIDILHRTNVPLHKIS